MGMVYCRGCGAELHESAITCPHCGAQQKMQPSAMVVPLKSQTVAALLCAFLGGFGAHRFYLGKILSGVFYLLLFWTGIPGIIAFFELFVIAFGSQKQWAIKYNNGVISNPVNIFVKILALIFPVVFVVGVLAAIALPAYQDYTLRAKSSEIVLNLAAGRAELTEYLQKSNGAVIDNTTLEKIKSIMSANKNIITVDAFAYKTYADVVAKVKIGKETGSIYLATDDAGKTWNCVAVDLSKKLLPASCAPGEGPSRPTVVVEKPRVGLWERDFAVAVFESCVKNGREKEPPIDISEQCKCWVGKVSQLVTQEQAQAQNAPDSEVQALSEKSLAECMR